ncbi:hypothetical protein J5X98_26425 [Leptothermofonsia sichuanensis E412]|uniref:hypothetical protein n=1 Tax=Leptothermofonsia sichuanensis TaxID=2917832 RepID=UPI001CA741AA|nr:hypothetical protein [Leptothermofonsia sichuanensis]QZZ20716.1 hypothetical protein J5X98_26425 [Leptothermofonsia sichuanensis E412]
MSSNDPALEETLHRLRELRGLLLRLHKALLESERVEYEQTYGPIQSKGEFFQLVIGHEWFNWLRPISQYIVLIDESMSVKEAPITLATAQTLLEEGRSLLRSLQEATPAEQRYHQAIQRDPAIEWIHSRVLGLLI